MTKPRLSGTRLSRIFMALTVLLCLASAADSYAAESQRRQIDLSGTWNYSLPDVPDSLLLSGVTVNGTLSLPGTLDTNGVGIPNPPSDVTTQLARRVTYTGKAVFAREIEIPEWAAGKNLTLIMERARPTSLKVDGIDAGYRSSISAPQRYDLSTLLTPGRHTIEITVDNGSSIPVAVRNNSHACTESTQTNWNGIIGNFVISVTDPIHISDLRALSDGEAFIISGNVVDKGEGRPTKVTATSGTHSVSETLNPEKPGAFSMRLDMPQAEKWSEWNPALHEITVTLEDENGNVRDRQTIKSGLRKFATAPEGFTINGTPTFLRGKHDGAVWPLTGHVAMDLDSWRRYFRIIREYGINHVRFHSWCPPEACFQAADEAGVYLQPELTIWGEIDKDNPKLLEFLDADMENVLASYASHPSFTMFAVGNELWGEIPLMMEFIDKARERVPGLLATPGSNIYLGWNGHIPGEDYLVTCRVGGGEGFSSHARASFSFADADNGGIMNSTHPNTQMTFSNAIAKSPVPVIGHETGQYQFYPDYDEIEKYTGVLRPDNFVTFRKRAEEAGTLPKAKKYFEAAGKWASTLYKADMEMNLRTPGMGGFQILDLIDYPGQGTALVGILDAFMDSKGLITPEEWRKSCDEITVLANLPKYCFVGGEYVEIPLEIANFSGDFLADSNIEWSLPFASGTVLCNGDKGLNKGGKIGLSIPLVKTPQRVDLQLSSANGKVTNAYPLWIYPKEKKEVKKVEVTTSISDALDMLAKGKRVILFPDSAETAAATLGPLFQTDYWNYRMFKTISENAGKQVSPGTMGLLIDDAHPLFANYPTESHTNWQWFPVAAHSHPLVIDRLPASFDPIIEPIDNIERNYRLALAFDCWVGKGKLMVVMADLERLSRYPEGEWFVQAAKEYMASKKCKPQLSLTPRQLRDLLTRPSYSRQVEELRNVSYD